MKPPARSPAIVGIGATNFTSASEVSELELAVEAISRALANAGLAPVDVDGLATFDMDSSDPLSLQNAMSLGDLGWFSIVPYGGGPSCAVFQDAALAIEHGLADVVVVYRAANMRSSYRFGQGENTPNMIFPGGRWTAPYGIITPGQVSSMWFLRYLEAFGLTNRDLAPVVMSARDYASTNPDAIFYQRPIDLDTYLSESWVAEPVLRRPDCCLETDGGIAIVVSSLDRARSGPKPPIRIVAAARGMAHQSSLLRNYFKDDATDLPDLKVVAEQLWRQSRMTRQDISALAIYDSFSPVVLMALETLGFCAPGEAASFVADGGIGRGGPLPVNPNGGLIGEGYVHGLNGITEAVRQLRGEAVNQIDQVSAILAIGAPLLPSSGLILASDN